MAKIGILGRQALALAVALASMEVESREIKAVKPRLKSYDCDQDAKAYRPKKGKGERKRGRAGRWG